MSDFIPEWTALGTGIAAGEAQRAQKRQNEKRRATSAHSDDASGDESAETTDLD